MPSTIRIGKECFAAGLFWQPAPTAMVAAREARIVAAKAELAADLFCVRKRGVPQFGLGQRKVGHRTGMRAIAPALASSVPESSWIGVFPGDWGWLYVVVRKGAVMPDGDVLFTTEQDVRERLREEMSIGEWDAIFAPSHWQMDGSRSDDLADLISRLSDARLKPVVRNPLVPIALLCSVLGAGAGIWMFCFPSISEAPPVPNVPAAPPPPPVPWQGTPPVRALILACETAIEGAYLLPGFEMEAASCGASGSTITFRRLSGSIAWAPRNARILSPDRVTVPASLSNPLARRNEAEEPATLDSLRRLLWGAAQTYRLDSDLTEQVNPAETMFPGRGVPGVEASPFRALSLSFGGRLPPKVFADLLSRIPAFVVEEVSWQSNGWRVKGKAYVR